MKKNLLYGILFSVLTLGFAACSDDEDNEPWVEPELTTEGVYILNSGGNGNNNSTLGYYNPETKVYTPNVFQNQNNNLLMGDVGNDMVIYGSRMYILATNANKIYITDLKGKLLTYSNGTDAVISPKIVNNEPSGPRFATAYGGKVYVSTKAGYVARIDTTSLAIDKTVKVGANPEQMTVLDNKLYVANSGYGSGNTVSVVDLSSFTELKQIDVALNPTPITSDKNGNIYIVSFGNYTTIKSSFQKLNPTREEVTVIATDVATKITMNKDKDKLFILKEVWGAEGAAHEITYYDVNSEKIETTPYFQLPSSAGSLGKAYSMSVDPISGDVYIGAGDSRANGDMYVFSADGTYKDKFDTQGLYPIGAYFVTGVK